MEVINMQIIIGIGTWVVLCGTIIAAVGVTTMSCPLQPKGFDLRNAKDPFAYLFNVLE